MTRKILKVGTSAADTIPRISFKKLIVWIEKFIERYRPALEALAKK